MIKQRKVMMDTITYANDEVLSSAGHAMAATVSAGRDPATSASAAASVSVAGDLADDRRHIEVGLDRLRTDVGAGCAGQGHDPKGSGRECESNEVFLHNCSPEYGFLEK
jgi:hypothetical protein